MNEQQERILELIKKKKECDKRAQGIVLKLIETQVDCEFLLDNAIYIGPSHLEDVVEERRLAALCGWTLCSNSLDPEIVHKKQRYVIRGNKVLDITQRKAFCSSGCFAKSTHFKQQLLVSPLWLRDEEKETNDNVNFEILEDDVQLHGLVVNVTGLKLTDEDK